MATSKCPKCESTQFEYVENKVDKSKFRLNFVQCASCGCVVGVLEYYNIGAMLSELSKKLGVDL